MQPSKCSKATGGLWKEERNDCYETKEAKPPRRENKVEHVALLYVVGVGRKVFVSLRVKMWKVS